MSEIIQFKLLEEVPKYREQPYLHYVLLNHKGKTICTDNYYYQYFSDRVRLIMKAHDIQGEYQLENFIRYEYSAAPGASWRPVFQVHGFFYNRTLELIKVYKYGSFNEKGEFVQEKMKILQGTDMISLESVIKKYKLLPNV